MPLSLQRLEFYASDRRRLYVDDNDPVYIYVRCVCFVAAPRKHAPFLCQWYARSLPSLPPTLQSLAAYASDWRRLYLVGNDGGFDYVSDVCFVAVPRQHAPGVCASTSRARR